MVARDRVSNECHMKIARTRIVVVVEDGGISVDLRFFWNKGTTVVVNVNDVERFGGCQSERGQKKKLFLKFQHLGELALLTNIVRPAGTFNRLN